MVKALFGNNLQQSLAGTAQSVHFGVAAERPRSVAHLSDYRAFEIMKKKEEQRERERQQQREHMAEMAIEALVADIDTGEIIPTVEIDQEIAAYMGEEILVNTVELAEV